MLLRSEDWGIKQIAQALRLHEASISRHIDEFLTLHKLNPENGWSQGYLNEKQTQQLIDHLCDVTYLHTPNSSPRRRFSARFQGSTNGYISISSATNNLKVCHTNLTWTNKRRLLRIMNS